MDSENTIWAVIAGLSIGFFTVFQHSLRSKPVAPKVQPKPRGILIIMPIGRA